MLCFQAFLKIRIMKEKIELLAREKDFSALNTRERDLVLSEMSQASFEQLRAVLQAAPELDAGVQPSDRLRAQLLESMAAQVKPSWLSRSFSAQVPAWVMAACLLLGISVVWLFKPATVSEKIITEFKVRTDTVWQEKMVWRERVVNRERIVYLEKPLTAPAAFVPQKVDSPPIALDISPAEFTAPRVGTSLGDTPELMRFFTQGDK